MDDELSRPLLPSPLALRQGGAIEKPELKNNIGKPWEIPIKNASKNNHCMKIQIKTVLIQTAIAGRNGGLLRAAMRRAHLVASAYSLAAMVAMFVVIGDTTALTVSVSSPTNGQAFVTSNITVRGTANDFILVSVVNAIDEKLQYGYSSPFAFDITLYSGVNPIFAQANGLGGQSQVRVDVTYTPVIISSPKLTGTTFTLSVPTAVGFNYVLEFKNSLSDINWTGVQTNRGSGGMIGLTNNGAIGSSRIYRVRVQ
jgi:hypothetical protein